MWYNLIECVNMDVLYPIGVPKWCTLWFGIWCKLKSFRINSPHYLSNEFLRCFIDWKCNSLAKRMGHQRERERERERDFFFMMWYFLLKNYKNVFTSKKKKKDPF